MIDLIINDSGGVTVAHSLKALDGCDCLDIDLASGAAVLSGNGRSVSLGVLRKSMLDAFRPGMAARAVRTSGWSIARISPLSVRTAAPVLH